jgi:hypothetical protein
VISSKLVEDTVKPPAAGKGRPKGALNKTTRQAKEAIALAADELGGPDRLVAWVRESPDNERVFWASIYTKLVPLDVRGSHDIAVAAVDPAELRRQARAEIADIFGDEAEPLMVERK